MKLLRNLLLALAMLAVCSASVVAQVVPAPYLGGIAPLSVTTSTSSVALPASVVAYGAITIYNSGSVDVDIALGGSAITATTSGVCAIAGGPGPSCVVKAGTAITINTGSNTYLAAITASSTATLYIYQAQSNVGFVPPGGSGGGGVAPAPNPVTPTDDGGTITTGGTSQTAIASNASRKGCWIQNPVNATEDLYVSSTGSASTTPGAGDDADLAPGGSYSCLQGGNIITATIRVNAVTTGHAYIAKSTQ